jgi:mono/diheme cytochrome c family protein
MLKFVVGVVITLLVLVFGGLGLALLGFLPTRANQAPPEFEKHIAMSAMDNSVERHAPRLTNPVPPTDENLISGLKIYAMNCALCHGDLDRQPSVLATSFYPPPPNLILHPPDDAEWHLYFVIKNGVRYTGMPAWDKALPDQDLWKVTAFISRMSKLPPSVQEYWKKTNGGVEPPISETAAHDHK